MNIIWPRHSRRLCNGATKVRKLHNRIMYCIVRFLYKTSTQKSTLRFTVPSLTLHVFVSINFIVCLHRCMLCMIAGWIWQKFNRNGLYCCSSIVCKALDDLTELIRLVQFSELDLLHLVLCWYC